MSRLRHVCTGLALPVLLGCASKPQAPEPSRAEPGHAAPADSTPADAAQTDAGPGPLLSDDSTPAAPSTDASSPAGSDRPPHTIYRSEIDQALARGPGFLLAQLGPEPFRMQGRFVGWEITRVFPDLPQLCEPGCDLQVGDIILSVNGDRLETPTAFSNMVTRLPELDTLQVKSVRDEKRRVVTYQIVDR